MNTSLLLLFRETFYSEQFSPKTTYKKFSNCFYNFLDCKGVLERLGLELEQKIITTNNEKYLSKSFIYRAIKNRALNNKKEMNRSREISMDNESLQSNNIKTVLIDLDEIDTVLVIESIFNLAKLTIEEKAIFINSEFDNLKQKEISKIHKISLSTVRNKLVSAKIKLKENEKAIRAMLI
jgi:hypothetical protein